MTTHSSVLALTIPWAEEPGRLRPWGHEQLDTQQITTIVDFTMLCEFLLYSKVNQLCIYIYPLFLRFLPHIGFYRVLSKVPCSIQQVLISSLFYVRMDKEDVVLLYSEILLSHKRAKYCHLRQHGWTYRFHFKMK